VRFFVSRGDAEGAEKGEGETEKGRAELGFSEPRGLSG
jgi:hypothetical protein